MAWIVSCRSRPVVHEALRRATRVRFFSERDLRLHDRVQRGVQLLAVRHANTLAAVISHAQGQCALAHPVRAILPDRAPQGDRNAASVVSAP